MAFCMHVQVVSSHDTIDHVWGWVPVFHEIFQQHDDVTTWRHFPSYWPLWGEITGPRWIQLTKPVTQSFDAFFDLRLSKRLTKQSWGWRFEMLSCSLWHHCNECNPPLFLGMIKKLIYIYICMFVFIMIIQQYSYLFRSKQNKVRTVCIFPVFCAMCEAIFVNSLMSAEHSWSFLLPISLTEMSYGWQTHLFGVINQAITVKLKVVFVLFGALYSALCIQVVCGCKHYHSRRGRN